MLRKGEVRLRMLKGEATAGGALSSPLKSSGVSAAEPEVTFESSRGRGFLAMVTVGRGRGLPPNIPSNSEAELEAEDPSGEEVGGGEDSMEEEGELVSEAADTEVAGERVTESGGSTATPCSVSRPASVARIGLKMRCLLLAR